MKVGDRVYAAISLHRTGVHISQGDRGTVQAVSKGKTFTTGSGPKAFRTKHRSPDRVQVAWDNGETGWHDADVLST